MIASASPDKRHVAPQIAARESVVDATFHHRRRTPEMVYPLHVKLCLIAAVGREYEIAFPARVDPDTLLALRNAPVAVEVEEHRGNLPRPQVTLKAEHLIIRDRIPAVRVYPQEHIGIHYRTVKLRHRSRAFLHANHFMPH